MEPKIVGPEDSVQDAFQAKQDEPLAEPIYFFDVEDYMTTADGPKSVETAVTEVTGKVTQAIEFRRVSEDAVPVIAVLEPQKPLGSDARELLGQAGAFVIPRPASLFVANVDKYQALQSYLQTRFDKSLV